MPFASINFNPEQNPQAASYCLDPATLIKDLLGVFEDKDAQQRVKKVIEEYPSVDLDDSRLNKVSGAFVRELGQLTDKEPAVLFFDGTEKADEFVRDWLEKWIISPLVQNGKCLIVWAGRRPERWKRFEVRRRVRIQELGTFELDETKDFLKQEGVPHDDGTVNVFNNITQGHPLVLKIAVERFKELSETKPQTTNEEMGLDLLKTLVEEYVDGYALKDIDPQVAVAIKGLTMVRQFDVNMLRKVLQENFSDFKNWGRDDFGVLLAKMRSSQITLWDDVRKGYTIDPTVRQIVSQYAQQQNPALYAGISRSAIELYQEWISKAGENAYVYILEELYQQACLDQVSTPGSPDYKELNSLLKTRLEEYLVAYRDLLASSLDRLIHRLEKDVDLRKIAGDEAFEQFISTATHFRKPF